MNYPIKTWEQYEQILKAVAERRIVDLDAAAFLVDIKLIDSDGLLTKFGQAYFDARFVFKDEQSQTSVIRQVFRDYQPMEAMSQRLFGVPKVSKSTVDSVLRNVDLGANLTDRKLGTLLGIMAQFGLISYVKSKGEVVVLHPSLDAGQVPATVFISRETPFSNVMWLGRVLKQCEGHIYWFDKHFQAAGLEAIADTADGNSIREVRILSLALPGNSTAKVLRAYRALKTELLGRGINLEWRFIDSTIVRDTHDRWIIGSDTSYNVPDVGTIMSGNKSEMSASNETARLNADFLDYWGKATEVS